jgi:quercetin dioxygenase-like cupin family protein
MERGRERERPILVSYERDTIQRRQEIVRRQFHGQVVVTPEERPFQINRQAKVRHYLKPGVLKDTCTQDWNIFVQELPAGKKSGRHRHQGGLTIFILEGDGKSWIEGAFYEWKEGDLLILPLRQGEVEHQHYNLNPDKPAYWIALINESIEEQVLSEVSQVEVSPLWKGKEVMVTEDGV